MFGAKTVFTSALWLLNTVGLFQSETDRLKRYHVQTNMHQTLGIQRLKLLFINTRKIHPKLGGNGKKIGKAKEEKTEEKKEESKVGK